MSEMKKKSETSNALRLIKHQPKGYERQFHEHVLDNNHSGATCCTFTSFTLLGLSVKIVDCCSLTLRSINQINKTFTDDFSFKRFPSVHCWILRLWSCDR